MVYGDGNGETPDIAALNHFSLGGARNFVVDRLFHTGGGAIFERAFGICAAIVRQVFTNSRGTCTAANLILGRVFNSLS